MTRALPRALASWAEELSPFSDETRAVVGPWLPALERLLGPHADQADPMGEPDGFSGLGRHGRYERLALSQWGLLDAAPDEFLRRAGSGEHLFHQLARAGRAGGCWMVVLFDAGPAQLGLPRLVHLAWLLVLSRRSQRSGIPLSWGILQRPQSGLHDQVDATAVRALLSARSSDPVLPEHLTAWNEVLGPRIEGEERWVVSGSGQHLHEPLVAASLAVIEPDEPTGESLRVEALLRTRARSRALLPLPGAEVGARLLRDPFPVERGRVVSGREDEVLDAGAQLVLSSGPALVARLATGDLLALGIPRQPREEVQVLGRFSPGRGESVVAAGWSKGAIFAVTASDQAMTLHVSRGQRHRRLPLAMTAGRNQLPRAARAVLYPLVVDRRASAFWFSDGGWHLHRGSLSGGNLEVMSETLLTFGWGAGTLLSVGRVGSGDIELFEHGRQGLARHLLLQGLARMSEGHLALTPQGRPAIVAVSGGDGHWVVKQLTAHDSHIIRLQGAAPVYGVVPVQGVPCLLVRSADGERLELVSQMRVEASVPLPGPVEQAYVRWDGQVIAAQIDGGVVVMERKGRILMRWGGRR
jgi:hypothetical protein